MIKISVKPILHNLYQMNTVLHPQQVTGLFSQLNMFNPLCELIHIIQRFCLFPLTFANVIKACHKSSLLVVFYNFYRIFYT